MTDPFYTFPDHDMDDPEEQVEACHFALGDLSWQQLQSIAGALDVCPKHPTRAELTQILAEELVFTGPIGDSTIYIRVDGESVPVNEHLENTE